MGSNDFLGLPLDMVWLPILLGIGIGLFLPLRPFMRRKLHFTIKPNDKLTLERDVDALSKIIPEQKKDKLTAFCYIIRSLGLTLHIE